GDRCRWNWLLWLLDALVNSEYERCKRRVAALRKRNPGIGDDNLANHIVRDASFWSAAVGVGVGAVQSIPGVGQAIAAGNVAPEIVYLTKLQASTAIQIALVYDYDLDREQLVILTLACLAYSYAFDVIKEAVKNSVTELTKRAIERVLTASAETVA